LGKRMGKEQVKGLQKFKIGPNEFVEVPLHEIILPLLVGGL